MSERHSCLPLKSAATDVICFITRLNEIWWTHFRLDVRILVSRSACFEFGPFPLLSVTYTSFHKPIKSAPDAQIRTRLIRKSQDDISVHLCIWCSARMDLILLHVQTKATIIKPSKTKNAMKYCIVCLACAYLCHSDGTIWDLLVKVGGGLWFPSLVLIMDFWMFVIQWDGSGECACMIYEWLDTFNPSYLQPVNAVNAKSRGSDRCYSLRPSLMCADRWR